MLARGAGGGARLSEFEFYGGGARRSTRAGIIGWSVSAASSRNLSVASTGNGVPAASAAPSGGGENAVSILARQAPLGAYSKINLPRIAKTDRWSRGPTVV